jgi:hypothetical protein
MNLDDAAPPAYYVCEGDGLRQGGVQWDVGPNGKRITFPVIFPSGASTVEIASVSGGRAWFSKRLDDHIIACGVVLHCEPAGGVAWTARGEFRRK